MLKRHAPLIGIVAFVLALYATFRLLGYPAGLFCTAFVGGFVLWLLTTYRAPVPADRLVASHILTVILFIVHVFEEFRGHIELVMSRLTGLAVSQTDFLTIAAFIAPVIWLSGILLALRRSAFGYYLVCVFYFGMMFGELSHFAFPFILDGRFHYVAGMCTALLPCLAAWRSCLLMRREVQRHRMTVSSA